MSLNEIKILALRALMQDEKLMYDLVLKGGNALQLVYDITDRASMDFDFSIEGDFSKSEFERINNSVEKLLKNEFLKKDLVVFDFKFFEKPKAGSIKFWKGYKMEFKVIKKENWYDDDSEKSRREAIKIVEQSTKFIIEISSFEYVAQAKKHELDGNVLFVYTPEMIIIEKLRALCQSIPEYSKIVPSANRKERARDFFDIWNVSKQFNIDITSIENQILIKEIFEAKKVPLNFLKLLSEYKDLHKGNWQSVENTIGPDIESFEYYFDFVMSLINQIKIP